MYTPKEIQKSKEIIINEISNGNSIQYILDTYHDMPRRKTIYNWLNENNNNYDANFLHNYTRATVERADHIFDEMIQIADTTEEGTTKKINDKGYEITTSDMIQHRRLRVDTRKWILGRMNPKKYGDSQQIKLTDNDGDALKINAIFSTDILNVPTDNSTEEDK